MLTHLLLALYLAAVVWLFVFVIPDAMGADRYPTSRAARRWHPPAWWRAQALCLHRHESADWHRAWVDWRGRKSIYAGGLQFTQQTWESARGRGEPWQWTPREQMYRAWIVWQRDGHSWAEWGTRGMCSV